MLSQSASCNGGSIAYSMFADEVCVLTCPRKVQVAMVRGSVPVAVPIVAWLRSCARCGET
jgi:hypothetical protein